MTDMSPEEREFMAEHKRLQPKRADAFIKALSAIEALLLSQKNVNPRVFLAAEALSAVLYTQYSPNVYGRAVPDAKARSVIKALASVEELIEASDTSAIERVKGVKEKYIDAIDRQA